jgi:hypothetical protein
MMEDPQHMKVDVVTATLLGALLGGLIGMAGSVVGALVELLGPRYLRTRGDIKLRTSRWELEYLPETSSQPAAFHYHLSIHMSNEMEVDTAAQDVQMVLRSQGENLAVTRGGRKGRERRDWYRHPQGALRDSFCA